MLETKYAECEFDDAIDENAQPLASNFDGVLQDAMMVCCRRSSVKNERDLTYEVTA
jgi:hypothetical protein